MPRHVKWFIASGVFFACLVFSWIYLASPPVLGVTYDVSRSFQAAAHDVYGFFGVVFFGSLFLGCLIKGIRLRAKAREAAEDEADLHGE